MPFSHPGLAGEDSNLGATSSLGQAAKHQSQDRQKLLREAHFQCGAGARQVFEHFQKVAGSTYRKAICPHVYCSFIFSTLMGVPVEYPPVGMFSGGMTVFLKREVPALRIQHPPSADARQCKPYGGSFRKPACLSSRPSSWDWLWTRVI